MSTSYWLRNTDEYLSSRGVKGRILAHPDHVNASEEKKIKNTGGVGEHQKGGKCPQEEGPCRHPEKLRREGSKDREWSCCTREAGEAP